MQARWTGELSGLPAARGAWWRYDHNATAHPVITALLDSLWVGRNHYTTPRHPVTRHRLLQRVVLSSYGGVCLVSTM